MDFYPTGTLVTEKPAFAPCGQEWTEIRSNLEPRKWTISGKVDIDVLLHPNFQINDYISDIQQKEPKQRDGTQQEN